MEQNWRERLREIKVTEKSKSPMVLCPDTRLPDLLCYCLEGIMKYTLKTIAQ